MANKQQEMNYDLPAKAPAKKIRTTPKFAGKDKKDIHVFTDAEMSALLAEGYIRISPLMYDKIPPGARICYVKRDKNEGLARAARFRPGGYVISNSVDISNGKRAFRMENRYRGKRGDPGYIEYSLYLENIEELFKQYDPAIIIEMQLIFNSLAEKKQQIDDLTEKVAILERKVR